jgi:hypothetical protein
MSLPVSWSTSSINFVILNSSQFESGLLNTGNVNVYRDKHNAS